VGELIGDGPRQEFVDPVNRVIRATPEHLAQIRLGINAVELRHLCRAPNYVDRARHRSGST
jgi:hypothetical protein